MIRGKESQLIVEKSFFSNFLAYGGAAIHAEMISSLNISQSIFVNNEAQQGGALKLSKIKQIQIESSVFDSNRASDINLKDSIMVMSTIRGGAVFYSCIKDKDGPCEASLIKNNKFINNTSDVQGGAISIFSQGFYNDGSNIFMNNMAKYHSNDISLYPEDYRIKLRNDTTIKLFDRIEFASGRNWNIEIELIDRYGVV